MPEVFALNARAQYEHSSQSWQQQGNEIEIEQDKFAQFRARPRRRLRGEDGNSVAEGSEQRARCGVSEVAQDVAPNMAKRQSLSAVGRQDSNAVGGLLLLLHNGASSISAGDKVPQELVHACSILNSIMLRSNAQACPHVIGGVRCILGLLRNSLTSVACRERTVLQGHLCQLLTHIVRSSPESASLVSKEKGVIMILDVIRQVNQTEGCVSGCE